MQIKPCRAFPSRGDRAGRRPWLDQRQGRGVAQRPCSRLVWSGGLPLRFSNFVPRLCLALAFATLAAAQAPAPPPAPPPLTIADGAAIVAALTGAPAQGLEAPDETADAAALADPDPVVHADAEARLIKAAIAYAQAEHGADLDPRAIDKDFALRAPYDAAADFAKARAAGQIAVWITGQTRQIGRAHV